MKQLSVKQLSFSYKRHPVLRNLSMEAGAGQVYLILGPNGAGKSTLLKCAAGLLKPEAGSVCWEGQEISSISLRERAKLFGYVPQSAGEAGGLTVIDTVLSGRFPYMRERGLMAPRADRRDMEAVESILSELDLSELAFRTLSQLSGGERQRVLVARALAQEPEVLFLDEPTSNLDLRYELELMELLAGLARQRNMAVIAIIHDLNLALEYGDCALLLKDGGALAEGRPREILTPKTLRAAYGVEVQIAEAHGRSFLIPFGTARK